MFAFSLPTFTIFSLRLDPPSSYLLPCETSLLPIFFYYFILLSTISEILAILCITNIAPSINSVICIPYIGGIYSCLFSLLECEFHILFSSFLRQILIESPFCAKHYSIQGTEALLRNGIYVCVF